MMNWTVLFNCIVEKGHLETLVNEDMQIFMQQMGTGAKVIHF